MRGASRLDAFSVYPVPAWLLCHEPDGSTDTPEASPPRSSRTTPVHGCALASAAASTSDNCAAWSSAHAAGRFSRGNRCSILSFVAETFSAFMVAQQRRNYDVPMGTSLTPLETLTVESFFLAALTTISKTLFGKVSDSILIWNDLK